MSQTPQDPFGRPGYDPSGGERFGSEPPRRSNVWLWVIGGVLAVGLLGVLACCGSIFFAFQFGSGMLADQLQGELQGNPVIREHIGDVESAQMNLTATAQEAQEAEANDVLVFDVEGSIGKGRVTASQRGDRLRPRELILPDGTRHPLESMDDLNLDMDDIEIPEFDPPQELSDPEPSPELSDPDP